jgi:hypothetical protein
MKIVLAGRTDLKDFFSLSGIRESRKLSHHPFIVFIEKKDEIIVEIVDSPARLIEFPASTKVMAQWGGKWASDFFQFTAGDLKEYIRQNPKESYHII